MKSTSRKPAASSFQSTAQSDLTPLAASILDLIVLRTRLGEGEVEIIRRALVALG